MQTDKPLVSILLPVCNGQKYLSEAMESILSQKYENIEVIAVDDCSKDESMKLLRKFREKDKRIRIYKNLNRYGLTVSLNRALTKARGEFISFMPQDARITVQKISRQVSFLLSNPQFAAVGSQSLFINENRKVVGKSEYPIDPSKIEDDLISTNSLLFESFIINKKLLPKDLLRFDDLAYPFLYSTLFMKICKYSKIANLEAHLITFRINTELNKSLTFDLSNFRETLKVRVNAFLEHNYKPSIRSLFSL